MGHSPNPFDSLYLEPLLKSKLRQNKSTES